MDTVEPRIRVAARPEVLQTPDDAFSPASRTKSRIATAHTVAHVRGSAHSMLIGRTNQVMYILSAAVHGTSSYPLITARLLTISQTLHWRLLLSERTSTHSLRLTSPRQHEHVLCRYEEVQNGVEVAISWRTPATPRPRLAGHLRLIPPPTRPRTTLTRSSYSRCQFGTPRTAVSTSMAPPPLGRPRPREPPHPVHFRPYRRRTWPQRPR